jgi:hypothetical protein
MDLKKKSFELTCLGGLGLPKFWTIVTVKRMGCKKRIFFEVTLSDFLNNWAPNNYWSEIKIPSIVFINTDTKFKLNMYTIHGYGIMNCDTP